MCIPQMSCPLHEEQQWKVVKGNKQGKYQAINMLQVFAPVSERSMMTDAEMLQRGVDSTEEERVAVG